MSESIVQRVNAMSQNYEDARGRQLLFTSFLTDLTYLSDRIRNQSLTTGGLAIKAGSSALVKTASTVYALGSGVLVKLVAADMPALVGSVTNAKFNVYVFTVNSAGTTAVAMGTEGATIGALVFPATPQGSAIIGFVIINPTGTGPFVGGTTALDDGTVVPNAVYVNTLGAFDPATALNTIA